LAKSTPVENNPMALQDTVSMDCPMEDTEDKEIDNSNISASLKNKVDGYMNFFASTHAPHVEKET
jgi:hypothetical protein